MGAYKERVRVWLSERHEDVPTTAELTDSLDGLLSTVAAEVRAEGGMHPDSPAAQEMKLVYKCLDAANARVTAAFRRGVDVAKVAARVNWRPNPMDFAAILQTLEVPDDAGA